MARWFFSALGVMFCATTLTVALAQQADEGFIQGLKVAEHEELGPYLTDASGQTLYLFVEDRLESPYQGPFPSTCYEQCAEQWPPAIVESWPLPDDSEAFFGEGVDDALVDVVERDDETLQLTYGDAPLYYFSGDEDSGEIAGQGAGDVWYMVAPDGKAIGREEQAEDEADADQEESREAEPEGEEDSGDAAGDEAGDEAGAELMAEGEEVYRSIASPACASCHGEAGEGASAPPIIGTRIVQSKDRLINQIVHGGHFMPSFGGQLSDAQVAAVATFVRNSWGNDYGVITEEEVSELR